MHTTDTDSTTFEHNGDFSGYVLIRDKATRMQMKVPFDDIKAFVAAWVRQALVNDIESQSDDELLLRD